MNWCTFYDRKRRIKDGNDWTLTGRDCHEATPGRSAGRARCDAILQVQITEQTYYRWRKQYVGMGMAQLNELKRLQKENGRLRRAVSALTPDKLNLSEAAKGNFRALHCGATASTWCSASSVSPNAVFAGLYSNIDRHTAMSRSQVTMKTVWSMT